MRQIAITRALSYFLEELWYTEAALAADPDAADLAHAFDATINEWDDVSQRERLARRALVRADAVVAVRDEHIDTETGRFATLLKFEAGNDTKGTFYKRFFTEAPSTFVGRNLRDQCEQTRDRIVPEIRKQPETSLLRPFADRLADFAKSALAALTARTKARGENASVASDVADWKEGVNRLRTVTYAELLKRATEKKYGKDWVETFFRRDDSSAAVDDTPDEPVPPAPPAPQPR